MLFGLGLPQWLTILALLGAVYLTFWVMAKGAAAYARRREAGEAADKHQQATGEDR